MYDSSVSGLEGDSSDCSLIGESIEDSLTGESSDDCLAGDGEERSLSTPSSLLDSDNLFDSDSKSSAYDSETLDEAFFISDSRVLRVIC